MLAHARKIENISLSLAAMIHLLQPHIKCPCLFKLITEAQAHAEIPKLKNAILLIYKKNISNTSP